MSSSLMWVTVKIEQKNLAFISEYGEGSGKKIFF